MAPESRQRAVAIAAGKTDWDWFFSRAESWQIEPTVLMNLISAASEMLPLEVAVEAGARRLSSRATVVSKIRRANFIVEKLEDLGIPTIVLKGPATGVSAYDDPSLRYFADIDLMVRGVDVSTARDLVIELGFEPRYERSSERGLVNAGHALEFKSHALKVELHTELLSRYLRVPFATSEVWETSRLVRCADREIRVLAPYVELVFLAAHGAKHEWTSFRWICDVAQLVSRLSADDITRVLELSGRLHCRKVLGLSLQLVRDTFDLDLPVELENARRAYDTKAMSNKVLAYVRVIDPLVTSRKHLLRRVNPAIPALVFWCSTRERWRDRLLSASDLILTGG
jgi:hypothetical protein